MSNTFKIILLFLSCFMVACSGDDNQEARTPVASVQLGAGDTHLDINQSMVVHFTGVADQVVIYPGDAGHQYDLRDSSDTGIAVNKGLFTYSYSVPGRFHVVCVASTYDTYMGEHQKTDTCSFDVIVVDDVTAIDRIYSNITPNTFYATTTDDGNWLMCLPTKQVYNGREVVLNASRQRLYFDIGSDSTKIFVDLPDNEKELLSKYNSLNGSQQAEVNSFVNTTKMRYDLSKNHVITVRSDAGTIKNFNLYCLIYPEFQTITVHGVKGVLTRDAFDQSVQTYSFTLPKGTDTGNAPIVYTLDGSGSFLDEGQEVASGANVNLDSGQFSIVRKSFDNDKVQVVSKIKFVVNYK